MSVVALTNIKHGAEDGSLVEIPEGEPVKGLPKEVVDDLKEQGLVGDVAASKEQEDELATLREKVAKLEGELAEANQTLPNMGVAGQASGDQKPVSAKEANKTVEDKK